jgi:hypothetical protein
MLDRERMIAQLLQMAIDLGWTPPGDVIDQIIAGGLLVTTQATDACEVAKTTIHRWMEEAAAKGRPLGVLSPAGYLIGRDRLLDFIEVEQDRHERIKVEARVKKYAGVWSGPLLSLKKTVVRADQQ